MSDNTAIQQPSTPGDVISTEDVGGIKIARSKICLGAHGVDGGDVTSSNPLPVVVPGIVSVSGFVADKSSFVEGTTNFSPVGGEYNDSATSPSSGTAAVARITTNRALHVNLRSNNGSEVTSANPLPVTLSTGLSQANDTVGAVPIAGTAGGASVKRIISAASTNGTLVKASAGTLYSVRVTNFDTANAAFVKLYNETTNPPVVGTDTVFDTIACPAAVSATQPSVVTFSGPAVGVAMGTGIGFGITAALADNDTTAVGANKVLVTVVYN